MAPPGINSEPAALAACYRLLLGLVRRKSEETKTVPIIAMEVDDPDETQQITNGAGVRQDKTCTAPVQPSTNPKGD